MADWLNRTWRHMRENEDFIHGTFRTTVLITKDGKHHLKLERLGRDYQRVFVIPWEEVRKETGGGGKEVRRREKGLGGGFY